MPNFYKIIIILSIISLILPTFSFAQEKLTAPETEEEFKEIGRRFWEFFPKVFKAIWQEAVSLWQKMWKWVKKAWNSYIFPFFQNILQKIFIFFRGIVNIILERFKEVME